MRTFLIILLTLVAAGTLLADGRMVSYLQNDNRHELIFVAACESEKWTLVTIYDLRKDRIDRGLTLPKAEFAELWSALSGSAVSSYIAHPKASDKAAVPGFYSFTLTENKAITQLLVPRDSCPKPILDVVRRMKSYVEKIRSPENRH